MVRLIKGRMGKVKKWAFLQAQVEGNLLLTDRQIDGEALKQFQPSKNGNIFCGTGNDSWYGKIEIDDERKWVIRSQAP